MDRLTTLFMCLIAKIVWSEVVEGTELWIAVTLNALGFVMIFA